ncbi:MAG TPA: cation-translocating P-type ATPase [Puia sp.]|uniref:heavy metal translocating P-type ATPase n=1 Tax=Puia sp. TaxID=2045100 RepID=UPI002C968B83|nr:cation-translocating P-type ATPase [Puia sp.]HVU99057.1 cation-translocating P-type ATPase [Puia sp.]
MHKTKWFLAPVAVLIGGVLIANSAHLVPHTWRKPFLIVGALAGSLPLLENITRSLKQKKVDLGIPVVLTLFILLYTGELLIANIFALLIVMGNVFKEYILWRVERSVKDISRVLPDIAFRKTDEIREVRLKDIRTGDTLVVKAGERVPVDGILLGEEAVLDESVITGESRLITKEKGVHLVAGSINQGSSFEMQVTSTSENSTLSQIHKMVEEAQRHNSPLSRFTDKFALSNALIAFAGTLIIYLATHDLMRSLAFWVALVPVVFAIIVPVATTIGISILAKRGILVKTGEALEDLTRIDSIAFDKTGTLTKGSPEISKVVVLADGFDESILIGLAASVEKYSEHPLSKAFLQKAGALHLVIRPVTDLQIIKGKGLQGICQGKKVLIGSRKLFAELGLTVPPSTGGILKANEDEGRSAVFIAVDGIAAGIAILSDELREGIGRTIATLTKMGIRLTMITGDSRAVAEKVAAELGLTRFFAETLPQDKIGLIRDFKARGERVIMIGDGINDAPAISESNVGVAMGLKGTDITLNSAKVVLVNDDIGALPYILTMSKRVLKIIRLDLYLATSIHVLAAVLSVAGVISLLGSAVMHQVSSTLVLLNTIRLYRVPKTG